MSTTAILCDIKRFSVHDGSGIRTTLFFKGCPLRCRWCHNPETLETRPELGVFLNKCIGCGECAAVCSCHHIINGRHEFNRTDCTACGKCVEACLFDALELYGRKISVAEAVGAVLEDRAFYAESGGGVTVSGGEPLRQAEFCGELFRTLKRDDIHTAVDTCGEVPWSAFETVLPWTDLFLYDFKHADSARHRELTGCGNERIKENLMKLSRTGKPIEIRMPLIPTLNMAADELHAAGAFLSRLKHLTLVRLLAYHSLAHAKYAAVGRTDTLPEVSSPGPGELATAAEILRGYQLQVIY